MCQIGLELSQFFTPLLGRFAFRDVGRAAVDGRATFPAQKSDYSVPRQIAGTMSALAHLNVHSSYGTHATVFAFGKGLEGTATTGDFVTNWTGSPRFMRSRIVVKPMILPNDGRSSQ
jgi:hypothetical protein